jgi:hypothetical protein
VIEPFGRRLILITGRSSRVAELPRQSRDTILSRFPVIRQRLDAAILGGVLAALRSGDYLESSSVNTFHGPCAIQLIG